MRARSARFSLLRRTNVASSVSDQSQAWPSYMPILVVEIDLHPVGHSAVRANGPFRVSVASNRCTMFRLLLTVASTGVTGPVLALGSTHLIQHAFDHNQGLKPYVHGCYVNSGLVRTDACHHILSLLACGLVLTLVDLYLRGRTLS